MRDVIAGHGPHWRCYVVTDDTELVGFIIGRIMKDQAEIDAIVVGEGARRTGLGSALLRNFETAALANGAEQVFLEVRVGNRRAKTFYASHGYQRYRTRHGYYTDGEDAVCLRRRLECETAG